MSLDYVGVCTRCGGVTAWISAELPKRDQKDFARDVVGNDRLRLESMETEDTRKAKWCFAGKECDGTGTRVKQEVLAL